MGGENPSFASHGGPLAGVGVVLVGCIMGDAKGFTNLVGPSVKHVVGVFHKPEHMDIRAKELDKPAIERYGVKVGRRLAA